MGFSVLIIATACVGTEEVQRTWPMGICKTKLGGV